LIVRFSGVECVKLPLFPVTVTVNVPFGPPPGLAVIFKVEPFPLDAEGGVKLAEVRPGNPEMLKVTMLLPFWAVV
jgi:hypothetical protein